MNDRHETAFNVLAFILLPNVSYVHLNVHYITVTVYCYCWCALVCARAIIAKKEGVRVTYYYRLRIGRPRSIIFVTLVRHNSLGRILHYF